MIERAKNLAGSVSSADEREAKRAAEFAAELVVYANTKRPESTRRRERRDVASLEADRAIFEHPDGHRLNHRERELTRHLAGLGVIRHLREHPDDLGHARAVARDVVAMCIGIALPAQAGAPAR